VKRSNKDGRWTDPSSARTRFALEALFLILVASGAALAQLSPAAIVALMLVAWILVALIERASAREQPVSDEEGQAFPAEAQASEVPARERHRRLFRRRPREAVEALASPTAALEERPSRAHVRRVEPEAPPEVEVSEEVVPEPEPVGPAVTKRPLELPGLEEAEPAAVPQPAPPPRPEPRPVPVEAPVRASQLPPPPPPAPRPPAREWNLWELERKAREQAGRADRDEEWAALFIHLRSYANAEGILPKEFDELVRESFPELIQAA
jgi:hypothetical protein